MAFAVLFCLAGCAGQADNTDIALAADAEFAEEEKNKKRDAVSVHIKDNDGLLNLKQKELIYNYGIKYAETLKNLQAADISEFYADAESEECYINKTAFETLVNIRSLSPNNLQLEYVAVDYRVESVTNIGNAVRVVIVEDNVQKFPHIEGESLTCNTYHEFDLVQSGENWLMKSHIHEEDFYLLTRTAWDDISAGSYAQKAEKTVDMIVADAQENYVLRNENLNEYSETDVNKKYDREKAVEYAEEWYNKRNPDYLQYDLYGGNCQNFASQCIHAGGMDMDIKGTYTCQWKFYGKDLNYRQAPVGRSYSWIGVDEFHTYAVYNRRDGLMTQPDIALGYAQKGDVIQVGAYNKWHHSLVVTDIVADADGNQTDILLASNTADRWNYPLSAYIYTYPRLIHIDGHI